MERKYDPPQLTIGFWKKITQKYSRESRKNELRKLRNTHLTTLSKDYALERYAPELELTKKTPSNASGHDAPQEFIGINEWVINHNNKVQNLKNEGSSTDSALRNPDPSRRRSRLRNNGGP